MKERWVLANALVPLHTLCSMVLFVLIVVHGSAYDGFASKGYRALIKVRGEKPVTETLKAKPLTPRFKTYPVCYSPVRIMRRRWRIVSSAEVSASGSLMCSAER